MEREQRKNLSVEIRKNIIMLVISFIAFSYLIYLSTEYSKWKYYCAVASAYILTKGVSFANKLYKNIQQIKSEK